ncbi:MAG: STAS domain-containing protein, partial [Thermoanaerobaculia bacterium]
MKISSRQREGITILQPQGKITIGVGDVALRDAVHQALDAGGRKILLDLGSVTTVDSSGIGEMVSAFTTVTNRGGQLKLLNLPPKVTDILQITQL